MVGRMVGIGFVEVECTSSAELQQFLLDGVGVLVLVMRLRIGLVGVRIGLVEMVV
jgi:hypothetical protein